MALLITFSIDHRVFFAAYVGEVVFEVGNYGIGFRPFKNNFGLAFVELSASLHVRCSELNFVRGKRFFLIIDLYQPSRPKTTESNAANQVRHTGA